MKTLLCICTLAISMTVLSAVDVVVIEGDFESLKSDLSVSEITAIDQLKIDDLFFDVELDSRLIETSFDKNMFSAALPSLRYEIDHYTERIRYLNKLYLYKNSLHSISQKSKNIIVCGTSGGEPVSQARV